MCDLNLYLKELKGGGGYTNKSSCIVKVPIVNAYDI